MQLLQAKLETARVLHASHKSLSCHHFDIFFKLSYARTSLLGNHVGFLQPLGIRYSVKKGLNDFLVAFEKLYKVIAGHKRNGC